MAKKSKLMKFLNKHGVIAFKGATSYELQVHQYWVTWCFLKGGRHGSWLSRERWRCGIDKLYGTY